MHFYIKNYKKMYIWFNHLVLKLQILILFANYAKPFMALNKLLDLSSLS